MKKMNQMDCESGMTLLETMFAVAIFSVIFAVLFQFMNASNMSWTDAEIQVQLREQAERAVDRIFTELRAAGRPATVILNDLQAGATQNGFYIPPAALERGDGRTYGLGFRLPAADDSEGGTGAVLDQTGQLNYGNQVLYFLNTSGELVRTEVTSVGEIPNTGSVLARNVSFFEVVGDQNTSPSYVDVRINLQNTSLSKRLVLYVASQDSVGASAWRGSGTRISLRNMAATDPVGLGTNEYQREASLDPPGAL